jgi:menaquinone-9 beta-reductase
MNGAAEVDVLIVGSGPAGISTALHLVDRDPDWADRILVVDKAVHPREKLCGGGVTGWGMAMLDRLGYELEPRSVAVREMRVVYRDLVCTFRGDPVFRVVRRSEFDHWFVGRAEARGVLVRQGEAVTGVTVGSDHVLVTTELGQIRRRRSWLPTVR